MEDGIDLELANFFFFPVTGQIVTILGFVSHMVSVANYSPLLL